MLYILDAIQRMEDTLAAAEASNRQLVAVRVWQADIDVAVAYAAQLGSRTGMHLSDSPRLTSTGWVRPEPVQFIYGQPVHRAWVRMCQVVIKAMRAQHAEAIAIATESRRRASRLKRVRSGEAAALLQKAITADAWAGAAMRAVENGKSLIKREDKIMRPVGEAIAAVGGLDEVAKDKHYHQANGQLRVRAYPRMITAPGRSGWRPPAARSPQ